MRNWRNRIALVAVAAFIAGFGLACQQAAEIQYFEYVNDAAVPRISAEDAKKEVDAGNAVFVDSRGDGAYNVEHLPGALNIAFGSPDDKFVQLPKGKKIIVYCS